MKRALLLAPLLLVALAGCTEETDDPTVVATTPTSTASPTEAALPPEPQPTAAGPCPYLDEDYVADTNGQHVGKVQTSADQPPACFFYRPDGSVQLTVRVYRGDANVAKALVDAAAPVTTSNPAELPGGWKGGAESKDSGAVYAVAKDSSAVVVSTNQEQTIKAKEIAKQAITALGL
ncbi:DUF2020 domain-containing protein [Actinophytocola sp.]|uniref:DUF2020 domain-containing protein n=1 Tax=Actinophytocola sp. TaxID=1872138 RepID=UPI003899BE98